MMLASTEPTAPVRKTATKALLVAPARACIFAGFGVGHQPLIMTVHKVVFANLGFYVIVQQIPHSETDGSELPAGICGRMVLTTYRTLPK